MCKPSQQIRQIYEENIYNKYFCKLKACTKMTRSKPLILSYKLYKQIVSQNFNLILQLSKKI